MKTCDERRDLLGDLLWPRAIAGLGARQTTPLAPCTDCIAEGGWPVVYRGFIPGEKEPSVVITHPNAPSQTWVSYDGISLCHIHATRRAARFTMIQQPAPSHGTTN
jgi:hypothetical protein